MGIIKDITAREVLDSRGNPTVETTVFTESRSYTASVPSGASTGSHEAKELRDGGDRYHGKGVLKAVKNVNEIIKPLLLEKQLNLQQIDELMLKKDGTTDKSNLGANAILSVSMACTRAKAGEQNKPLYESIADEFSFTKNIPTPLFNIINGGEHGAGGVSFQEFMLVPEKESFSENLRFAAEFFYRLKSKLAEKYGDSSINIGDEGGFVPAIKSEEDVLRVLNEVQVGVPFLIDVAATEFFKESEYVFKNGERKTTQQMISFYQILSEKFKLLGLEDPLEENDFIGWGELKKNLSSLLIVGDDLLVTNTSRMETAHHHGSCNAIILKINQIGSISEAVRAVLKAKEWGWKIIVSHRSGETNDDFIADFAVGIGAEYIKSGAPQRGERIAKYNRLLEIENNIKKVDL